MKDYQHDQERMSGYYAQALVRVSFMFAGMVKSSSLETPITWELLGQQLDLLKFLFQSWKRSRQDIAGEAISTAESSPRPSPASPAGGNGPRASSRLHTALQRLLAGDDISSGDQETIRLYARLLLSCLSPQPPTG